MKMSARVLLRCPAGMKYRSPLTRRDARKLKLLEGDSGHRRDVLPSLNVFRSLIPNLTDSSIRTIGFELERKQFQSSARKLFIAQRPQRRAVFCKTGGIHAVFERLVFRHSHYSVWQPVVVRSSFRRRVYRNP